MDVSLFDFDLRLDASSTGSADGGCWMLCRYNFSASRPVRGATLLTHEDPLFAKSLRGNAVLTHGR